MPEVRHVRIDDGLQLMPEWWDVILSGGALCKGFALEPATPPQEPKRVVVYWLEPGGQVVDSASAEMAIASGDLVARADGLFAGNSQSWIMR